MASSTLDRFCEKVAQIIRTEGVACYGLGVADNRLHPEAVVSLRGPMDKDILQDVDLDSSAPFAQAAQQALDTREPLWLTETITIADGLSVAPMMVVPIVWAREPVEADEEPLKRPVGLLTLWNKRGADNFNEDDFTLVKSFSGNAAALLVEEQLEEFEDIQTAFATVPVGLMLVDRRDNVLVANAKALQILEAQSVKTRTVASTDHGGQIASLLSDLRQSDYGQANISFVAPGGENHTVSAQLTQDGQSIVAFTQSPFTTAAEELTGQVAHELRTPLTVIEGNLQTIEFMLGPDMVPEDMEIVEEFVGTALVQSARMFRLISETLNISRIHAGKEIELDVQEFDLVEALDTILMELADYLIRHEVVRDTPETLAIQGDRGKVISIFDNFLKNAAKYANPGTTIGIRMRDENGTAVFEVEDQGIGIPADALEKIGREAGFRTSISKKQAGGIGLGMVYVRRVIEAHGGEMQIESEIDKGSVFRAILPKDQP